MQRTKIREIIGFKYLTSNIENEEFSYQQALTKIGKNYEDYLVVGAERKHKNLDIRFSNDKLSILIETKNNIEKLSPKEYKKAVDQLQSYLNMERALTNNEIVCILASIKSNTIEVYYGKNFNIKEEFKKNEKSLKEFEEYEDIYFGTTNNKIKILENTYELNEILHSYGIKEELRSQFVGTCLLALKNGLVYTTVPKEETDENGKIIRKELMTTRQITIGIEDILKKLLEKNLNKAEKLVILKNKILDSQDIGNLDINEFKEILNFIEKNILPYINDKNTEGQDILNLFFTTFNKYVGKKDKNQAFTPDHIVKFMCYLVELNKNSKVLDPCCGSGAFLVRALTTILDLCNSEDEKNKVKSEQIHGVEYEENAFGLATTNMLIHSDGNSNIIQKNIFDTAPIIKTKNGEEVYNNKYYEDKEIDVVLMNPPFNAQKKHCEKEFVKDWDSKTTTDPSKGLHFVNYVANRVNKGNLAVILPTACAIGGNNMIDRFKKNLLENHTLKAVFSLPNDIFNPGTSVSVCCMLFELGKPHIQDTINGKIHPETFFGYYKDDGFIKKKKLGRIEKFVNGESLWEEIYKEWIELYNNKIEKVGKSIKRKITADDEWLAEAYMETDYSTLTQNDFEKSIKNFLAYKIKYGDYIEYK